MTMIIPDQALNTHIGVLGKTGAGKSYTARGLVERLLTSKRHVCIVDPTGAWWGLRTGFDIPIFGGAHGDIEINDKAGEAVARVIDEQGASAIVDLSLMSGGAQRRFMRDFAKRLRAKASGAFWLVLDEADEFLPQQLQSDMTNLFGDLKWMVRRGRLNGFRVMMITQRPAEIAKAVLTQIETLVAHRLTAPQDRKAIEEWVKGHHDPSEAREVLSTLASLNRGEAWVWCPDIDLLRRAKMPEITTFDSGRTPEPGETRTSPPGLANLDLSAIKEVFRLPKPQASGAAKSTGEEKPLAEGSRKLAELQRRYDDLEVEHCLAMATGQRQIDELMNIIGGARRQLDAAFTEVLAQGGGGLEVDEGRKEGRQVMMASVPIAKHQRERQKPQDVTAGETATLSRSAQKLLHTLQTVAPRDLTMKQCAILSGVSVKSSALGKYWAEVCQLCAPALAGAGWYWPGEHLEVRSCDPVAVWVKMLTKPQAKLLQSISEHGPVEQYDLAVYAEISHLSSALGASLKALKSYGLIEEPEHKVFQLSEDMRI
jgi:uncharacterized protein